VIPLLLWVIERLVAAGHELHVLAHSQEFEPGEWSLLGARVHNAGRSGRAGMFRELLRRHRQGRFDVLHAFWAVPAGEVAAVARRLLGVPVALWLPGGDLARLPEIGYGLRLRPGGRLRLRFAVAGADRVLVPSRYSLAQAQALGMPATVVPFGVALDRWPSVPPRGRSPGQPGRLLHVASLNRVKDQPTLLRALARLHAQGLPFRLDVVGEDTLGGSVQQLADSLGLGGVVSFHGFLTQPQLRRRLLDADLLLLSSRHETGPLVLHEAAACGVPTVGTAVGELPEWAPDAAAAVPVGDDAALAEAVAGLLADEPGRLRLAERAQARVLAWNADSLVARMLELSRELSA
jgi:glycosyltransferase involved in cell wall biosynthesis